MKFIFYDAVNITLKDKIEDLRREFPDVEFISQEKACNDDIQNTHAFVGIMPPEHFQIAEKLRIIFVSFTGPNMMPFDEMRKRGIRLSNTHGNARFVAERAFSMCLAFLGKIMEYDRDIRNGKWHGIWAGGGLQDTWDTLWDKKCAVIGTGEIGKWIAKYLKIFNCHVIGFKKRPFKGEIENFDEITLDLKEAINKSEIVFATLPLTDESNGIFSSELLSGMKDKILVNVGRGQIIDEQGLYNALKNRILRGACIDVWYTYPEMGKAKGQPSKYPFNELDNIIMSPHVAGYVQKSTMMNLNQTIENIRSYIKTGSPVFEIDLDRMY